MTDTVTNVELAAELTAAWLSNPNTRTSADDVPAFLLSMHAAVTRLSDGTASDQEQAGNGYLRSGDHGTQVACLARSHHLDD